LASAASQSAPARRRAKAARRREIRTLMLDESTNRRSYQLVAIRQ
jgi:hypothetical protein